MKFEKILPVFLEGKKIKVVGSSKSYQRNEQLYCTMKVYDILYSDWEIAKEPKKIKLRDLTEEKLEIWMKTRCKKSCLNCPMEFAQCNRWIHHKDLYSDKFLDQEIEIDE